MKTIRIALCILGLLMTLLPGVFLWSGAIGPTMVEATMILGLFCWCAGNLRVGSGSRGGASG